MKNLKILLALLFTLTCSLAAFSQIRYKGTVVEIVDGRTVVIELATQHKLIAELQRIEVPEAGQELHQTVREHLQKLLLGKDVEFLARGMTYTKTVGQLISGGIDISQQMLRDGAAWYSISDGAQHDSVENQNYQNVEALAKTEKRGVWSVPGLQPAWEFRARKEKINRSPQPEAKVAAGEGGRGEDEPVLTTRARNFLRQQAAIGTDDSASDYSGGMWTDVGSSVVPGESQNAAGLLTKYIPDSDIGYTATPILQLNVTGGGAAGSNLRKAVFRIGYFYKGASLRAGQDTYVIAVWSESKSWSFLRSNNLTLVADGRPVNVGKAYRLFRQAGSGVQELLLYRIRRATLKKIADSKTVVLKVGTFSSPVGQKSQNTINTLLVSSQ